MNAQESEGVQIGQVERTPDGFGVIIRVPQHRPLSSRCSDSIWRTMKDLAGPDIWVPPLNWGEYEASQIADVTLILRRSESDAEVSNRDRERLIEAANRVAEYLNSWLTRIADSKCKIAYGPNALGARATASGPLKLSHYKVLP